ncbi:MAG TPA: methyltransferase domain-containing protein, partial [Dongiaceae bacterium]
RVAGLARRGGRGGALGAGYLGLTAYRSAAAARGPSVLGAADPEQLRGGSGAPEGYFDLAVSVFALGWAIGLDSAMARIARCLKPGGRLVFSWEHPFFSLLAERDSQVTVGEPYLGDGRPQHRSFHGVEVALVARSLGDWIAALRGSGLILDGLIEPGLDERQLAEHHREPGYVYSFAKASRAPTTFIVAAHKPGASQE